MHCLSGMDSPCCLLDPFAANGSCADVTSLHVRHHHPCPSLDAVGALKALDTLKQKQL